MSQTLFTKSYTNQPENSYNYPVPGPAGIISVVVVVFCFKIEIFYFIYFLISKYKRLAAWIL